MPGSEDLVKLLTNFPMLEKAFGSYLDWLLTNNRNGQEQHKLHEVLRKRDHQTLEKLEGLLAESCQILRLTPDDFVRSFGFKTDLLIDDPEKIHDVIAEPLLVVKLAEKGFAEIKRLPSGIKIGDKRVPIADFTASLRMHRYAIELKTIRTESRIESGKPSGKALQPDWWGEMFISNARTKIEDKERKALIQLNNTCHHYNCQGKLLVLYTRRLGVAALSEPHEYREWLGRLREEYPMLDYLGCMDYSGVFVLEPDLT